MAEASEFDGAAYLLLVDTGSGNQERWEPKALQESFSDEETREVISADHKQADHAKHIYGDQGGSITLESLKVEGGKSSPAFDDIEKAHDNKDPVVLRKTLNGDQIKELTAIITNINTEAENNSPAAVEIEFEKRSSWETLADTADFNFTGNDGSASLSTA